jgi:hypothetical protein
MQQIYEELAQRYEREQEPRQRDNLLVLAADSALTAGRGEDAERLRQRLLQLNPHHLLRPFSSFAEAMETSDIQDFVTDLRRQYPPEYAQRLLGKASENNGPSVSRPAPPMNAHVDPRPRESRAASPYERFEVPLPPGRNFEPWGSVIAQTLFFIVFVAACALAVYVLARPFLP